MATVEERVITVTARVLELDEGQINLDHDFGADLGAPNSHVLHRRRPSKRILECHAARFQG